MSVTTTYHQTKFFESTHRETGLVTGFGGGKSWILVLRMLATKMAYPKINLGYISPTHSITRDVLYPLVDEFLSPTSIKYKINKSENVINFLKPNRGQILCRSAEDPGKIVGWTVGDMFIDEIDTLPKDKAQLVWNKALGRMRANFPDGKINQIFTTCTPEGFLFLWEHFKKEVEEKPKLIKSRNLIQASTYDNPYLPPEFIQSMLDNYPPELVKAYIKGEFVNLNAGVVYRHYDPDNHYTNDCIKDNNNDVVYVGQDFNYEGCVSILAHDHKDEKRLNICDEIVSKDTEGIVKNIKKKYPNKLPKNFIFIPDSSGKQRSTNATQTDITILKKAGFKVLANSKNPRIMDRVNSTNGRFAVNKLYVNRKQCPETHAALIQQIFSPKTGLPEKYHTPASVDDYNDSVSYLAHKRYPLKRPRFFQGHLGGT